MRKYANVHMQILSDQVTAPWASSAQSSFADTGHYVSCLFSVRRNDFYIVYYFRREIALSRYIFAFTVLHCKIFS
jgi:hypothetical protein